MLAAEYADVVVAAQSCTPGAPYRCQGDFFPSLPPCSSGGCEVVVNDATVLGDIFNAWGSAGRGPVPPNCPTVTCPTLTFGQCIPTGGGGGVCAQSAQGRIN